MPSANTVMASLNGLPSVGLGNATSETLFTGGKSGSLSIAIPANNELANRYLRFKVSGRVTPGASSTFQLRVYAGTAIAAGSKIIDSGAISATANSYNFLIFGEAYWDASSNQIQGVFWGQANNAVIALTAFSNSIASNPNPTAATSQPFVVSGLFGTSNANNNAFVDMFEVEVQ